MKQTQYELDLVAATYEQHGHAYAKKRLSGGMLFNDYIEAPIVRRLLGNAKQLRGKSVLDIGCGPGVYSSLLVRAGASVLGVDSSKVMLNATRETCEAIDLPDKGQSRFVLSNFETVDLGEERFDVVLATFMLSYFSNIAEAFAKMRVHLAPRGQVITSMLHPIRMFATKRTDDGYVVSDYFDGGVYEADFLNDNSPLRLRRYNFDEIYEAAGAAGLKISGLFEPRASLNCGFPDQEKVSFYSRHPSILILQLTLK